MLTTLAAALTLSLANTHLHTDQHPGSGLEVASDGTVYLADVARKTIWRISPEGEVAPAVTSSWTHEFHLTAGDTLVYEKEHLGYEQAPQSIWTLTADGQRTQVVAPPDDRSKFGSNAFARSESGEVFFAHRVRGEDGKWRSIIRQRAADDLDGSAVRTIAGSLEGPLYRDGPAHEATFRMILDMRLMDDGTLYLLDRDRLRMLAPDGTVSTLGPVLIDASPKNPPTRGGSESTWNRLYGLCVDSDGAAHVAYNAGRRVVCIDPDGSLKIVHTSDRGWAPLGVAFGPDGAMHISEASDRGSRLRVLRFEGDKPSVLASIPAE